LKRRSLLIVAAIGVLLFLAPANGPGGAEERKPVYLVEVEGIINPATSRFITESIDRAVEQGSQCVIIELDTPGGLMDSMRAIVKKILTSPVPIVVYVGPRGARAASAGVFITMAAHVAAMAPSTHIGAAHPVNLGGEGKESQTMSEKIVNDTVSYIKTIAKTRGRNVDWAEKVVRKSVSITEEEAVKLNVVDFVSPDLPDLLARLDGRVITLESGQITLATRGLSPRKIEMGWRYRILDILSNPSIAYILLMLGIYGVFFELSNPGAILPGVVGGIFLILAFFALQMLPINFAGLALILFAIILFIAEIKVVSHGLLSVGGVISLFLGSIMLIDSPADYMRISMSVIIPAVVVSAAFFLFAITMALRARLAKPTTGREGLRGEIGTAVTAIAPEGKVSVHGEYWNAVSPSPIEPGGRVRVVDVKDLKLKVEKID
jgi:membrane-bound serine protease (ClpP class)